MAELLTSGPPAETIARLQEVLENACPLTFPSQLSTLPPAWGENARFEHDYCTTYHCVVFVRTISRMAKKWQSRRILGEQLGCPAIKERQTEVRMVV